MQAFAPEHFTDLKSSGSGLIPGYRQLKTVFVIRDPGTVAKLLPAVSFLLQYRSHGFIHAFETGGTGDGCKANTFRIYPVPEVYMLYLFFPEMVNDRGIRFCKLILLVMVAFHVALHLTLNNLFRIADIILRHRRMPDYDGK